MRRVIIGCLCLLLGAVAARGQEAIPLKTLEDIKSAAVFLKVTIGPLAMNGSGFVMQTEGDSHYIVTNQHVVSVPNVLEGGLPLGARPRERLEFLMLQRALRGAKPVVKVVFYSGTKQEQEVAAEVLGADEDKDLAILKVVGVKAPPKPIVFPEMLTLVETTPVYVFGFPFGQALSAGMRNPAITVGKGSVSSLRLNEQGDLAFVQIDGALNPGNSGGPVVDNQGRLAGVAVATIKGAGIRMAIPPAEITKMLEGRAGKAVAAHRTAVDGTREIEVIAALVDPFKKLKSVTLHYVVGDVAAEALQGNGQKIAGIPGSEKLELKIETLQATGRLPVKPGGAAPLMLTLQLAYAASGKTEFAPLQVLRDILKTKR